MPPPQCVYTMPMVLPDDLIAELLSFLPVKSLVRFKCVSKSWKTLISDPTFVKLHLNGSSTRSPLFTLVTVHLTTFSTVEDDNRELEVGYSVVPYSLNRLIENPSFTLSMDRYYHLSDKQCSCMIGTCDGLILLAGDDSQFGYFRLWNPATMTISPNFGYFCSFHSPFPDHPFPFLGCYNFNFGCDISTGTYKVVASCYYHRQLTSDVRILSIGDNVWREIQSFPVVPLYFYLDGDDVHDAVYLSGTLNWLCIHNEFDDDIENLRVEQFVVVSFDLGTEKFSQYRLPRDFDEMPPMMPIVSVLGGFLCCSYFHKETDFLIWQMKELGVEDSWTQLLKISYQNLQIDYDYFGVEEFSYDERKHQMVPVFLSADAKTLVLRNLESEAILYNWKENRVERTKKFICWSSAKVYVESLASVF